MEAKIKIKNNRKNVILKLIVTMITIIIIIIMVLIIMVLIIMILIVMVLLINGIKLLRLYKYHMLCMCILA